MTGPYHLLAALALGFTVDEAPDYASKVAPIFKQYCVGCHNDADREGKFSLETFARLQAGTPKGPVLKPGDATASRIIRLLSKGAKPSMPPEDEPRPTDAEVDVLKAWINAGAKGPGGEPADRLALAVPRIESHGKVRPVTAIAVSRDGRLAVGRDTTVEFYRTAADGSVAPSPEGPRIVYPGKVTSLSFTPDGSRLVAASGVAGLGGLASIRKADDGSAAVEFRGHLDLLYDAELSPDGKTLATSSYDKTVRLWDAADGRPLHTLAGHNGAVYDVGFSPDGQFLVSSSADDTCKVWRVSDGTRMDTLPQPLKEEYCGLFAADGRSVVAAGADHTIRVWDFVSRDRPQVNPIVRTVYAHEGPIVRLALTPDGSRLVSAGEDRAVKVWNTSDYAEIKAWEHEPDVPSALAVSADGKTLYLGRMDGSLAARPLPDPRPAGPAAASNAGPAAVLMGDLGVPSRSAEVEPNDTPEKATALTAPAEVTGVVGTGKTGSDDVDLFRFHAKAGEEWVIEINAARSGSKLDPFVEVLDASGARIPRVVLQAVRSSYFTFRGHDDSTVDDFRLFNWDEMRINEYLYANGEVVRLWLFPRGPDSGFRVYPGQGKRWGYFDTTPLAHALNEPCYVVEAHPPGSNLVPNGLPVFTLYYENDDDARRELGKDSRLNFAAPADGDYLLRVRDVRGQRGPDFKYTLAVRPRRPDFRVTLDTPKLTVGPGGARGYQVKAKRVDDFDGPIRVYLAGLPKGFSATTPLTIEPGQIEAFGVVTAEPDAAEPTAETLKACQATASATVDGHEVTHPVKSFAEIKLAGKPKLRARIVPAEGGAPALPGSPGGPLEFEIRPGQTITLKVKLDREGEAGTVAFGNEGAGRNLPFGVFIDNLGLNGLLLPEGQNERTFFVTASRSVPRQSRLFYIETTAAGGQASTPVLLHVR